jgi:hypothetical protein
VLIREVVQRFCSRADRARICARFAASPFELDAIIAQLIIRRRIGQDTVEVDIPDDMGQDQTGQVKRQTTTFADLIVMASNDPDSTQGYDMSAQNAPADGTDTTPAPPNGNGSASVVASVLLLLLALAMF